MSGANTFEWRRKRFLEMYFVRFFNALLPCKRLGAEIKDLSLGVLRHKWRDCEERLAVIAQGGERNVKGAMGEEIGHGTITLIQERRFTAPEMANRFQAFFSRCCKSFSQNHRLYRTFVSDLVHILISPLSGKFHRPTQSPIAKLFESQTSQQTHHFLEAA